MPLVAIIVVVMFDVYPDQFDHWHRHLVEFTFSTEGLEAFDQMEPTYPYAF
jgi:hypothetical protein